MHLVHFILLDIYAEQIYCKGFKQETVLSLSLKIVIAEQNHSKHFKLRNFFVRFWHQNYVWLELDIKKTLC